MGMDGYDVAIWWPADDVRSRGLISISLISPPNQLQRKNT
jgi:hypothetical protein